MQPGRRRFLALLAGGAAAAVRDAAAADAAFPARPITLVVPYPAGGASDALARTLAEAMAAELKQPVVVDNRPGASAIVGTQAVAKAPADGHTLLLALNQSVLSNRFLFKSLPYDVERDFAFVSEVARASLVLAVHPSLPVQSVKQLLAWLHQHPEQAHFGSWGNGSYPHVAGAYLAQLAGVPITHVPYKGEAPMLNDLVGGQIRFAFASVASLKPLVESGRLRALAITGQVGRSALPLVPSFPEAGVDELAFQFEGWAGLLAPAATPPEVVRKLEHAARAAVQSAAMQARLQALGMVGVGSSGEAFRRHYQQELPVWQRLVRVSGVQPE